MVLDSINISIKEITNDQVHYLYFKFEGKFTEETSKQACIIWLEKIKNSSDKYILIWDCLKMEGFEMGAKKEWLNALKLTSDRTSKILVVSDSIVTRGAARLMLKLYPFKSEMIKSLDSLPWIK